MAKNACPDLAKWLYRTQTSQAELCRACELNPSSISRVIKGERWLSIRHALRVSTYTGIPVENLVNPAKILVLRRMQAVA